MKPEDFIGMSKKGAQNFAEAKNMIFRLIRVDKEQFYKYPKDIGEEPRTDRICIEIDNGKVSIAIIQ